jgi:hypothetical protein
MQKKSLLPLFIIMFIPFFIRAEWIPLNKQNSSSAPPNVTLLSDDNNSTVIKIEISGFELKDFNSGDQQYQKIDLLSESFNTVPGFPELPYIAKVLAIPDQAGISVEVLETGDVQSFSNIHLAPARESWLEGSPETPYTENADAYNSMISFPGEFVQIDQPSVFRDFRIARVSVFPVQYNASKKELQVTSSITVRINYGPGEVINPKITAKKPIAPSFGQLYKSMLFNYESVLNKLYGGKEDGHELMLCIMPDEFVTSFQTYATWKRQSGIDIHVTKFSDIGANSSDPAIIKTHIADAYHNWAVPPTYVLLVGDDGVLPWITANSYVSENYFVEIDGNDYFPELMLGRFTNQSDYGLQVMINKFIKYEKTPYTTNTSWFKKGICCSNNEYPSQLQTKREAAAYMLDDGGFTSVDTMMSNYPQGSPCTYSNADVSAAINEGRSFLNYRGEGWTTGWWAACTPMTNTQVSGLANGEKFTFVTSIGCGVAMFASGESFGETWLELGTLANPRGAAAFIGPAGNTHTAYNNNIDRGIYKGMFQEGMDTPGQALLRGKLYMYNVFGGGDSYVSYHYKIYCVLGDPSIHIWKDVPHAVTVSYPATIPFGNNLVQFSVNLTSLEQPVANAVVCVTGNDIFATGITDANGITLLEISGESPETLTVTVRGGNVIPFQGTIDLIQANGPWITQDYFQLNDIAGGNGNGLMDFGESIQMSLAMKNVGTIQATNVSVMLTSTDPYITLSETPYIYNLILPGQSVLAINAFSFTVAENIPDGHEVLVNITATMLFDTWNSYITMTGHAPNLSLGNITILDPAGNNNGLLDPGETVTITIPVSNIGSSISPGGTVNLSSISGLISINTTSDDIGPINTGSSVDAFFNVSVSPTAPEGESVDLNFNVAAGSYTASKTILTYISAIIEDWETGNFDKFPWVMGGNANWTTVTDNPYEGVYCARSGNITDSQVSDMALTLSVTGDGNISFFRKVSSESNYDYLRFYIDGNLMEQWSGNFAWGQVSYPVSAGVHTFLWKYYKDSSVSSGEDCVWIDYIEFPSPLPPVIPPYQTAFDEMGSIPDGWYNDSGDDFDWTILSGPTPSSNTGPSGDHTTGTGYYMYTEATLPNNPNKRADLVTPAINLSFMADAELTFWFHMYDNTVNNYMGTLHLDVFVNDVWIEDIMTPISGNHGDQWHQQVVDLTTYAGEIIELRFRGITGLGYASDICIDDFSIDGTPLPSSLVVDLTVFLEGPCIGNEMSTYLCACSALPLSQPFNIAPWNYNGTESVVVMPGNAVDWVLVELRDAATAAGATPSTTIARQAGLLFSDGSILATDGNSHLSFSTTISNSLFVVVHHRNHLAVMSANPLSLSGEYYSYDFTTSIGQAYGTNSQKQLTVSICGMISGDVNANGTIGNEDIIPLWKSNAGKAGYYPADLNLDQQVDNRDRDSYWLPNNGMGTGVPD